MSLYRFKTKKNKTKHVSQAFGSGFMQSQKGRELIKEFEEE